MLSQIRYETSICFCTESTTESSLLVYLVTGWGPGICTGQGVCRYAESKIYPAVEHWITARAEWQQLEMEINAAASENIISVESFLIYKRKCRSSSSKTCWGLLRIFSPTITKQYKTQMHMRTYMHTVPAQHFKMRVCFKFDARPCRNLLFS